VFKNYIAVMAIQRYEKSPSLFWAFPQEGDLSKSHAQVWKQRLCFWNLPVCSRPQH